MQDYSFIGKGELYLNDRYVGNASACDVSITDETIEQRDYTAPGGGIHNSVRRVESTNFNVTLLEFSPENLALAVYGDTSVVSGSAVTDESATVPAALGMLVAVAGMIDTDQAVTVTTDPAGTTYVKDTDYSVNSAGIVPLEGGSISAAEALLISYADAARDVVQGLTTPREDVQAVLVGKNEAQGGQDIVLTVHRIKFGAAETLSFIGDEFGEISLVGDMLKDVTIADPASQYFHVDTKQTA